MRRTKIVATLGPSSSDEQTIRKMIETGVDVFRLNFSHGSRESHRLTIQMIRAISAETGIEVAILQDLCGPKIRTGEMENGSITLVADCDVSITSRKVIGTNLLFGMTYKPLAKDISPGNPILLDDGKIKLSVLSISGDEVLCRVIRGGVLKSHKGINLPGAKLSTPSITQKDVRDMVVGLEEGVDFIALSFVRHPDDILKVRKTLERHEKTAQIIAKIEKPEALEHIDEILSAADGIMVARGDLGVEMDLEKVPMLQKDLIRRANETDKYVITATQMLESMISSEVPTRAETADVANAIVDGTDAIMLSGETAAGQYPLEAVMMMDRIARETEKYLEQHPPAWDWDRLNPVHPVMDALGHATKRLYADLNVKAIGAFSASGGTALFLSKSRPFAPIIAFTARKDALRRMRIFWGVNPVMDNTMASRDELRSKTCSYLMENGITDEGKRILLVSGTHFGQLGSANGIEIATVSKCCAGPQKKASKKSCID